MAIDPSQIELTDEQKKRVAEIAERKGVPYTEVLNAILRVGENAGSIVREETPDANGASPSLYDALNSIGAIGCFDGPGDLSTNPKHMEGFGVNASRKLNTDVD